MKREGGQPRIMLLDYIKTYEKYEMIKRHKLILIILKFCVNFRHFSPDSDIENIEKSTHIKLKIKILKYFSKFIYYLNTCNKKW